MIAVIARDRKSARNIVSCRVRRKNVAEARQGHLKRVGLVEEDKTTRN